MTFYTRLCNSSLYVDHARDDLFEQIDAHMRWIKENPEEAKLKALKAHEIFLKKFTLEKQLSKLYENFQIQQNNFLYVGCSYIGMNYISGCKTS